MRQLKTNYDRYLERELKKDPSLREEIKKAGVAVEISMQLYSIRKKRGFTQKKLAELAGIKQSNVARLENASYEGYSLSTLKKIAKALKANLNILFVPKEAFPTDIFIHKQWGIYPEIWTTQIPYTTSTDEVFILDFPSSFVGRGEEQTLEANKVNIDNDGRPEASALWLSL